MVVPLSMLNSSPPTSGVPLILSNSASSPPSLTSPSVTLRKRVDGDQCNSGAPVSSADHLKRRRPAKINIPITFPPMLLLSPVAIDTLNEIDYQEDAYSVYCKRGKKGPMQDRYSALLNLQPHSKQGFFGVFDGHGGSVAADFAAKHLDKNIMEEISRRSGDQLEEAIKDGYLKTDRQFILNEPRGGACCVTALIRQGQLIVSNAGDCRAVMSRGGVAEPLTFDHRPSRLDETARIESLGGYVDSGRGVCRVQGSLAVSRSIGDGHLKPWVTAEPETTIRPLGADCEFLILASDGLWDKVDNQEAVNVIRTLYIDNSESLSCACKKLVELSIMRGSIDDVSLMIVELRQFLD